MRLIVLEGGELRTYHEFGSVDSLMKHIRRHVKEGIDAVVILR